MVRIGSKSRPRANTDDFARLREPERAGIFAVAMLDPSAPSSSDPPGQLCCPDCHGELRSDVPSREARTSLACSSCGQVYSVEDGVAALIGRRSSLNVSEVATQDRVADQYDGVRYQRRSSVQYHEDTMQQLVELAAPRGTVLDDGCGTGAFLEFVRRRALRVDRYVGIDVSRRMLAHAKRRLDASGTAHVLVQADACRLPFKAGSFDVVYARALLHHLPEPAQGVAEIARVLKPGGVAVVLDPNKTLLSTLPRYLARRTDHFDDDHKNFRADELEGLVRASLEIDEVRFFGYLAYPLLGFPDLIDFDRWGIGRLTQPLLRLDRKLGSAPGIRRLGWGIMIKAHAGASQ
jgi:ubiquinone/menaquinone biosynthesis C-methylase UbiE